MEFRVSVVLPAAGIGSRMKIIEPKQFVDLRHKPVVCHAINAFEAIHWIDAVVVTVPASRLEQCRAHLAAYCGPKLRVECGAESRHRSIWSGLRALANDPPDVAIVHDAVRPFVDVETIETCARLAWKHGASGATRPLVSTIVAPDSSGFLDRALDRSKHRASEMPQGFRYDLVCRAYEASDDYDLEYGTECLHLVHKYCQVRARLFEGPENLWKITYQKDLCLAEMIIRERAQTRVLAIGSDLVDGVREGLPAGVECRNYAGPISGDWDAIVVSGTHIETFDFTKAEKEKRAGKFILIKLSAVSDLRRSFDWLRDFLLIHNGIPVYGLVCQCRQVDGGSLRINSVEKFTKVLSHVLSMDDDRVLAGQIFIV